MIMKRQFLTSFMAALMLATMSFSVVSCVNDVQPIIKEDDNNPDDTPDNPDNPDDKPVTGDNAEIMALFKEESPWTIIGTLSGSSWNKDFSMKSYEYWSAAFSVTIKSTEEFKFRENQDWGNNLGAGTADSKTTVKEGEKVTLVSSGGNIQIADGTYDIYIAPLNQIAYFLKAGTKFTHLAEGKPEIGGNLQGSYDPNLAPSKKLSGITYQINVYSFADSDGDGWGDFQGIIDHLDYLDGIGATALWLSPIHPAMSYHGYDVTDYNAVNPKFGGKGATSAQAEAKLKELIDKAAEKNIGIYLDYVLNHSGKDHPYFIDACKSSSSEWREAFLFSSDPSADIKAGKFAMIPKNGYDSGQWFQTPYSSVPLGYNGLLHFELDVTTKSSPKLTVTTATGTADKDNADTSVSWFIYNNNAHRMYEKSSNVYEITLEVNNDWGVLVKDHATEWGDHKWGAKAGDQYVTFGKAKTLVKGDAAQNITFGKPEMYHSHMWTDWFADWNYGAASSAKNSKAFKYLAASADKWIGMGIKGLRLDAVKHIYWEGYNDDNPTFLAQWYDHCNTAYKNAGGQGDFYMVGEMFDSYDKAAPYYKGLPSLFGFSFYWTLRDAIKGGNGKNFASSVKSYSDRYATNYASRKYTHSSGYYDAIKLTNHDEDRAASDFGNKDAMKRLAGAVLLTSPGKPFIYQGEELGYWGTKGSGDEYVRTPILWTKGGKYPTTALGGKVSKSMLTDDISVEAQLETDKSLLALYRHFAYARNTNAALANGTIEPTDSGNNAVAAWYMHSTSPKKDVLVLHNFSDSEVTVTRASDNLKTILVGNGDVTVSGTSVKMPAYSSIVFALN